ncbi:hypothetical protein MSG28_009327 [Choristoneura fumiferana]|uniref:Uncharacterized protein n=1 Tax=Choristoneura fumiferana TaxID=7141 RepID=A0ACC0KY17_CHOFU|nr:hypothetical protein MSG28_009327 [Choristoneura fumiferana]
MLKPEGRRLLTSPQENQSVVDQELRALISDNEQLSRQVKMLLKERLEHEGQDVDYTKELEDMRQQINLIAKERDSMNLLWQTSQKTIEALENELRTYQGSDKGDKQDIKEENRSLELKLDTALRDYIELETKYKELQTKNNMVEKDLANREKEINTYKERGKHFEEKLEHIGKDLEENRINLAVERKNNENLNSQVAALQKECTEKAKKEAEAKSKVAEALQLFDLVSNEKNELQKRVTKITGEMSQLKQTLARVKQDTEASYRKELDELREKYNEKVTDMLGHMRHLDTELVEKGVLLNRTLRIQVEHLQKSLEETHGMISKLQTMLTSRSELSQKWKESYVEMTAKLKKRIEELLNENKELRSMLKLPSLGSSNQEESSNS